MADVSFNEKALSRVLQDIYTITGIRMSIFEPPMRFSLLSPNLNYHNVVAYPNEMPQCFCRTIRKSKIIDEICMDCDDAAVQVVLETKKTYVYKCRMGFTEVMIPVLVNGEVVAIFIFGQLRTNSFSPDFNQLYDRVVSLDTEHLGDLSKEDLKAEFNNTYIVSEERIVALCRIIERFLPVFVQNNLISMMKTELQAEIAYYVQHNLDKYIKLSDVTEALNISQAHLCRIMKRDFGKSFTEYVNDLKIEKAKEYMEATNFSVAEISAKLGFDDSNYFSRLFKKKTGENTTEYKKRIKNIKK